MKSKRSLGFRIIAPVLGAVVVSIAITAVVQLQVKRAEGELRTIESNYVPAGIRMVEMVTLFDKIQRGLQDAAASQDRDMLQETNTLAEEFNSELQVQREMSVISEEAIGQLNHEFSAYWKAASFVTNSFIKDEIDEETQRQMTLMSDHLSKTSALLERTKELIKDNLSDSLSSSISKYNNSIRIMGGTTVISFLAVLCILFLVIRKSIDKTLKTICQNLSNNSEQTRHLSSQLREYSFEIADGASKQSASLQEIAASFLQISTMSQKNSEQAVRAEEMAKCVSSNVSEGISCLKQADDSIVKMQDANNQTGAIIKTIEEIAFLTNILALNAAVEAARAGDAGTGFAVVADEVRTLAMRCSSAARESSLLISNAQSHTDQTVESVLSVAEALERISDGSKGMNTIISEVAQASAEQSSGVEGISQSIRGIDVILQKSTESTQKSADSSQSLFGRVEELEVIVTQLLIVVRGSSKEASSRGSKNSASNRKTNAGRTELLESQTDMAARTPDETHVMKAGGEKHLFECN